LVFFSIYFLFFSISISLISNKIVDGRNINSAFPVTKVEQLNEEWIADELVVHESQIYPSYIVYYK